MTSSPTLAPVSLASGLLRNTSNFAAVLFTGLFAGFVVTVLVFEASLRGFGAEVYAQVRLIELQHLDDLATGLLLPGILAAATVTGMNLRQRGSRRWLAGAALLLLVATLLISVTISVPINTVQHSWSTLTPPADWAAVRDRWQLAHAVRTTAAVTAFALLATRSTPRTAA
ncbi:anthrone oxygenase family protein [Mycobacterium sp. 1423905.2]|uniref:anthrone oxygenase family protein n=1 Tax=Mycobacterium sp. 1423905.2 TaxID=1856859 RepID=UPI0007FFAD7C|nr:anthrone oxygenase family protein [Mycobacterium sp. 1423905.2]OBJ57024.1 hypothetical protein A9W95_12745 [Mycobacterium sp. 1423905.2]